VSPRAGAVSLGNGRTKCYQQKTQHWVSTDEGGVERRSRLELGNGRKLLQRSSGADQPNPIAPRELEIEAKERSCLSFTCLLFDNPCGSKDLLGVLNGDLDLNTREHGDLGLFVDGAAGRESKREMVSDLSFVGSNEKGGRKESEVRWSRTICLTTSEEVKISMTRLWILISKRSQVLVPSPQGDLRVVMRKTLVGMRAGPLTLTPSSLAPRMRSALTMCSKQCYVKVPRQTAHNRVSHTHGEARRTDFQRNEGARQQTKSRIPTYPSRGSSHFWKTR